MKNKPPSASPERVAARGAKFRAGKKKITADVSPAVFEAFADYRREHRLTSAAAIEDLLRRAGVYS